MPLALSVPIINKIYNRTKVGERLKLKPALRKTMTSPHSEIVWNRSKVPENTSTNCVLSGRFESQSNLSEGCHCGFVQGVW